MKIAIIDIPLHIGEAFYCVDKSFKKHKAKKKNICFHASSWERFHPAKAT